MTLIQKTSEKRRDNMIDNNKEDNKRLSDDEFEEQLKKQISDVKQIFTNYRQKDGSLVQEKNKK